MVFARLFTLASAALLGLVLPGAGAQCANDVAVYHPQLRTLSSNATWFIVPVPKAAVQKAVKQSYPLQQLSLLDVPTNDETLFPNGFPAGMHPVITSIGLTDDIRMGALQIDGGLKSASVYATYVSKNGKPAPLAASLSSYIAGENGPLPNGLVPAVASSLLFAGNPLRLGQFTPETAAYMSDAAGTLTAQAKWALVPNPVSGPGVYPEAVDYEYRKEASSQQYTDKTFKSLINQPLLLPSGMCQRNQYYFTNATALTSFTTGNVTLGPAASGNGVNSGVLMKASPDGSGIYTGEEGFTGCAQAVGFNPEGCQKASGNLDPAALK